MTRIDFNPSPKVREKARKVAELRNLGMKWDHIVEAVKLHQTYAYALYKWFQNQKRKAQENGN